MEGSPLYNSQFLGQGFHWWIGQIPDDSVWRDNILPGKFKDKETIKGWGYRYKVRIMGLHDDDEESLSSEDLPWAIVMYPITAGGGQGGSYQTPNIRQGNFVFGFFLDGSDQQQPCIMGVLGNNDQTLLQTKTSLTGFSPNGINFGPLSGFAEQLIPKKIEDKVAKTGLVTVKPKDPTQAEESAAAPPGVSLDKFGIRSDIPLNPQQLADKASALATAQSSGLTDAAGKLTAAGDAFVGQSMLSGMVNRALKSNSPGSPAMPGATIEAMGNHQESAAAIQLDDKYLEKSVLLKPQEDVKSAIKAIQTTIDNSSVKMDKYLNSLQSYADAVSSDIDPEKVMKEASKEIAKYTKIIYNKQHEYQQKVLNRDLRKAVAELPSSKRSQFADVKELNAQSTHKLFSEMSDGLEGMMGGLLKKSFNIDALTKQAKEKASNLLPDNLSPAITGLQNFYAVSETGGEITADTPFVAAKNVEEALVKAKAQSRLRHTDQSMITVVDGVSLKSTTRLSNQIVEKKTGPKVPMCYAEDLIAKSLSINKERIDQHNDAVVNNINRFLTDVKNEMISLDAEIKPKSIDASKQGAITQTTKYAWESDDYGGTSYVTATNVPTTVGAANSAFGAGKGTGCTVNITVGVGSVHTSNSHDSRNWIEILSGGAGYTANDGSGTGDSLANRATTGGSGSGLNVNYVCSGGAITGIAITAGNNAGSGYKDGDTFTINGGTVGNLCTVNIIRVKGPITALEVVNPGTGYVAGNEVRVNEQGSVGDGRFTVTATEDPVGAAAANKPPGQKFGDMLNLANGIGGGLTQSFNFKNMTSKIFDFELPPVPAVSDFYQLGKGGGALSDSMQPSFSAIDKAMDVVEDVREEAISFIQPTDSTPDLPLGKVVSAAQQLKDSASK